MKKYARQFNLIACIALLPFISCAQDSDLGNWILLFGNKKIDTKWNWHHEVQYRNYNIAGDLEQLLLRTGIGYAVAENSNLLLGYGFIHSQNYAGNSDIKVDVNEHRIFQQFITKQQLGKVGLQHRYRFEQRFVEDKFKVRFRYFLGLNVPFTELNERPIYLSAYNEIFLQTEGNAFDRNRLYAGIGHQLSDKVKVEVGYMNQFFLSGSRDQVNLVLFYNY